MFVHVPPLDPPAQVRKVLNCPAQVHAQKRKCVRVCVCVCVCGAMWQEGLEGPLVPSGRERVADREIGA